MGRQAYRLQRLRYGEWRSLRGTRLTTPRGFLSAVVRARPGARFRIWSPEHGASPALRIR